MNKSNKKVEKTVRVELGRRSYDIHVGAGLLDQIGSVAAEIRNVSSVVVISDSNVAELFGGRVIESLKSAGLRATLIDFPAGEKHKSLITYSHLFDELFAVSPTIDRGCLIVALGGGVTGDLAGFVAATALRGLKYIQCPTTLLADVDSSVGGKTAVDHPAGKNLIGAFHQPKSVIIDVAVLKKLPIEEIRSGLAECIKHAFIRDADLLDFIEQNAEALLACDADIMTDLIARNVAIKAAVVSGDERETAARAHLNFGHTVGHALETLAGYGKITHGQAIALGMIVAVRISVARRLIEEQVETRLKNVLEKLGLEIKTSGFNAAEIWNTMQHDKKVRGGKVRMVLPTEIGKVDVFNDPTADEVANALKSIN